MAENSKIQWTKDTWNPLYGCRKVSAGCKYCYAERKINQYKGEFTAVHRTSKHTWGFPYRLHKKLTGNEPFTDRLVFTCSMSDFFIEEGDAHRADMWRVIRETPHLIYQILTKRPERIVECLPDDWGAEGYPNVWLGTSVENQAAYDLRVPILVEIPAKVRFLSCEPLIDRIWPFLPPYADKNEREMNKIDWVIVGGESGNENGKSKYRPCQLYWVLHLMYEFRSRNVPIFVKQTGTYMAKQMHLADRHGGDINEWPEVLQVREFPKAYALPLASIIPVEVVINEASEDDLLAQQQMMEALTDKQARTKALFALIDEKILQMKHQKNIANG